MSKPAREIEADVRIALANIPFPDRELYEETVFAMTKHVAALRERVAGLEGALRDLRRRMNVAGPDGMRYQVGPEGGAVDSAWVVGFNEALEEVAAEVLTILSPSKDMNISSSEGGRG